MNHISHQKEKRRNPRFLMDLPLEYREVHDPRQRGGIVVNASEGGFLIESVKDMPISSRLEIAVLFPKWFELAELKLAAEIIWKEPLWKEGWKGYQYGLKVVQIIKDDLWKLQLLLRGEFNLGVFSFGPWKKGPD